MAQTTRQAAMTPKPYVKGVVPSIVCEVRPLRCCMVCDLVCVCEECMLRYIRRDLHHGKDAVLIGFHLWKTNNS